MADKQMWSGGQGEDHRTDFERTSTTGERVAAWAAWLAAVALQVLGVLVASGKLAVPVLSGMPALVIVVCVVVCAVLAIVGARQWRAAERAAGARGQGVVEVAMSCLAFAPMLVFFLTAKNAAARTRTVAAVCAVAMVAVLVVLWVL